MAYAYPGPRADDARCIPPETHRTASAAAKVFGRPAGLYKTSALDAALITALPVIQSFPFFSEISNLRYQILFVLFTYVSFFPFLCFYLRELRVLRGEFFPFLL